MNMGYECAKRKKNNQFIEMGKEKKYTVSIMNLISFLLKINWSSFCIITVHFYQLIKKNLFKNKKNQIKIKHDYGGIRWFVGWWIFWFYAFCMSLKSYWLYFYLFFKYISNLKLKGVFFQENFLPHQFKLILLKLLNMYFVK